jgi:hypothetical protein
MMSEVQPKSIAQQAEEIVLGRREQYGQPEDNFKWIAAMWTGLGMQGHDEFTMKQVALMMCCVKLAREVHQPKEDNLIDLIGYTLCADRIEKMEKKHG